MSLLLDALRKSEQRRRGAAPPPLGLPTGPAAGERRPPPSVAGRRWIIVLLAVALIGAVTWWGLGAPGLAPPAGTSPPAGTPSSVEPLALVESAGVGVERALQPDVYRRPPSELGNDPAADPAAAPATDQTTDPAMEQAAATDPAAVRAPERVGTAAGPGSAVSEREAQPMSVAEPEPIEPANDVVPPVGERWSARPSGPSSPTSPPELGEPTPGATGPDEPARSTARMPQPAQAAPQPTAQDPRTNTIDPWELPAALRSEFPDVDLAVHVFAPDPTARFVLIDGERYGEGDTVAAGVRLAEILRGGVIVEFRDYRIWIE